MITFSANLNVLDNEKVKKAAKLLAELNEQNREHAGAAYISIMEDKFTGKRFSLSAYANKADKNLAIRANDKVSLPQDDDEYSDNAQFSYSVEDAAIRDSDIDNIVEYFLDLREKWFLKKGVDLWRLVELADKYKDKKATNKLYYLLEENDELDLFSDLIADRKVMEALYKIFG